MGAYRLARPLPGWLERGGGRAGAGHGPPTSPTPQTPPGFWGGPPHHPTPAGAPGAPFFVRFAQFRWKYAAYFRIQNYLH